MKKFVARIFGLIGAFFSGLIIKPLAVVFMLAASFVCTALGISLTENARLLADLGSGAYIFGGFGWILLGIIVYRKIVSELVPSEDRINVKRHVIFALIAMPLVAVLLFLFALNISESKSVPAPEGALLETPLNGGISIKGPDKELYISRCVGLFDVFDEIARNTTPPGETYSGWHRSYSEAAISLSSDQLAAKQQASSYFDAYYERISRNIETKPHGDWLDDDELLTIDWSQCQDFVDSRHDELSGTL
jgi:hypothetical protein